MIDDFIVAELLIWALMIALLPVAAAIGLALVRYQADDEVRERLGTKTRPAARKPRTPPAVDHSRHAINLKHRRHA